MGKEYRVDIENLATTVINKFTAPEFGSCDKDCDMSLVELRDFWFMYCHDLITRLPSMLDRGQKRTVRVLMTNAQRLLEANDQVCHEYIRRRVEPRLGHVPLVRFGYTHLLPTLAGHISPELKTEIRQLIFEKYGSAYQSPS